MFSVDAHPSSLSPEPSTREVSPRERSLRGALRPVINGRLGASNSTTQDPRSDARSLHTVARDAESKLDAIVQQFTGASIGDVIASALHLAQQSAEIEADALGDRNVPVATITPADVSAALGANVSLSSTFNALSSSAVGGGGSNNKADLYETLLSAVADALYRATNEASPTREQSDSMRDGPRKASDTSIMRTNSSSRNSSSRDNSSRNTDNSFLLVDEEGNQVNDSAEHSLRDRPSSASCRDDASPLRRATTSYEPNSPTSIADSASTARVQPQPTAPLVPSPPAPSQHGHHGRRRVTFGADDDSLPSDPRRSTHALIKQLLGLVMNVGTAASPPQAHWSPYAAVTSSKPPLHPAMSDLGRRFVIHSALTVLSPPAAGAPSDPLNGVSPMAAGAHAGMYRKMSMSYGGTFASSVTGPLTGPPGPTSDSLAYSGRLMKVDSAVSMQYYPEHRLTDAAAIGDEDFDGTSTINQYVLLQSIGRGGQGEVMLAMDNNTNELRAVKIINRPAVLPSELSPTRDACAEKEDDVLETSVANVRSALKLSRKQKACQMQREIAAMKRCRHRNIVSLYEVIDDPAVHCLYLVMQYVERGSLVKMGGDGTPDRVTPPEKLPGYLRQLCAGLDYLHNHGIVHRDIKPDNILLGRDDEVYLADFGMSEVFESASGGTAGVQGTRGTTLFFAPELLEAEGDESVIDGRAVDVWALGLTFYILLYGRAPWSVQGGLATYLDRVLAEPIAFPSTAADGSPVDPQFLALLRGMLTKQPALRTTVPECRKAVKQLCARYDSATFRHGDAALATEPALTQVVIRAAAQLPTAMPPLPLPYHQGGARQVVTSHEGAALHGVAFRPEVTNLGGLAAPDVLVSEWSTQEQSIGSEDVESPMDPGLQTLAVSHLHESHLHESQLRLGSTAGSAAGSSASDFKRFEDNRQMSRTQMHRPSV
jgi:serine/threonine protein kinase